MSNRIKQIIDRLQVMEEKWKPIPFWSWNAKLEHEELKRQIEWMRESNMGGFFMHARGGLETEYLSEDWMSCIETCIDAAGDMDAWLYDENGWPSGFAGGKLLELEEDRDRYLLYTVGEYDPNASVSYLTDGDALVRVSDGSAEGNYLNVTIYSAASTADILNPVTVDKFINLTHEAYKARLGDKFKTDVAGFFTDEPQYQRWNTPYTTIVADYFREEYGEDILDKIGLLFVEKEGYREFRYRYWKAMQHLMLKNFAEKIYNWCDENGLKLTGHYVEENSLGYQIMCCAGVMPFYEFEHIPGIDWLGRGSDGELAQRQVGSTAAQMGKQQVLTEAFGCCGWDVTPRDLRRIMGVQFTGGVNLMCHHLVPYAETGQRKRDYPAHYSAVNPWVADGFADFNLYMARMGRMIAESKESVRVAMLHPIRSAYFDYKREAGEAEGFAIRERDQQLVKDMRRLSAAGIGYHFLDETLLARHGFVDGATIGCGQCSYDYLVLPHLLTMDKTTEALLRQYVQNGGKVLVMGDNPTWLEGQPYSYDYLSTNCTWEEIEAVQPMRMQNRDHGLYTTYRTLDGVDFLLVQNRSGLEDYDQTFDLGEKVKSFTRLDLLTMETEQVPLSLHFDAGDTMLLFPSEEPCESVQKTEARFVLEDATISVPANYLTLDTVRYSKDGVNFSKLYPHMAIFDKLLREHYEGDLYLKYEFEVRELPTQTRLLAESKSTGTQWMNGKEFSFTESAAVEPKLLMAEVADLLRVGQNDYTVKVHWYQDPSVYYALFTENGTESLKNCLVYTSDLEPVYLAGQFGVYSDKLYEHDEHDERYLFGESFYIGKLPETVTEPTTDGLPFFRGKLTVSQDVEWADDVTHLRVEGTYSVATVRVNGQQAGNLFFDRVLDIRPFKQPGVNHVEIDFLMSNRNMLGPHHCANGFSRGSVSPWSFELFGEWQDDKCSWYDERYELTKLNCY